MTLIDADALRTGGTARTLFGTVKAPSTLATIDRLGPRSPGPGEPGVAGTRLGDRGGTRRRAVDHRPGLHHLRDLRWPRKGHVNGYTGKRGYHPLLAIAAGTGDVRCAGCARAGPTPLVAPPTSCVKRWGGCATEGPAGNSRCGPTAASTPIAWYPSAASWTCDSPSPSASTKACGT